MDLLSLSNKLHLSQHQKAEADITILYLARIAAKYAERGESLLDQSLVQSLKDQIKTLKEENFALRAKSDRAKSTITHLARENPSPTSSASPVPITKHDAVTVPTADLIDLTDVLPTQQGSFWSSSGETVVQDSDQSGHDADDEDSFPAPRQAPSDEGIPSSLTQPSHIFRFGQRPRGPDVEASTKGKEPLAVQVSQKIENDPYIPHTSASKPLPTKETIAPAINLPVARYSPYPYPKRPHELSRLRIPKQPSARPKADINPSIAKVQVLSTTTIPNPLDKTPTLPDKPERSETSQPDWKVPPNPFSTPQEAQKAIALQQLRPGVPSPSYKHLNEPSHQPLFFIYGIRYIPSTQPLSTTTSPSSSLESQPHTNHHLRTITIANLPRGISLLPVLSKVKVRDGSLVEAKFLDTSAFVTDNCTAVVRFMHARAAAAFVELWGGDGADGDRTLVFGDEGHAEVKKKDEEDGKEKGKGRKALVKLIQTPTFPLPPALHAAVYEDGNSATRCLSLHFGVKTGLSFGYGSGSGSGSGSEVAAAKIKEKNDGVMMEGVKIRLRELVMKVLTPACCRPAEDTLLFLEMVKDGIIQMQFASVRDAVKVKSVLESDEKFREEVRMSIATGKGEVEGAEVEVGMVYFERDPCDGGFDEEKTGGGAGCWEENVAKE